MRSSLALHPEIAVGPVRRGPPGGRPKSSGAEHLKNPPVKYAVAGWRRGHDIGGRYVALSISAGVKVLEPQSSYQAVDAAGNEGSQRESERMT